MMTRDQAVQLLQGTYYDGIDAGDMKRAAAALHEDVEWSHAQVWAHHEFNRGEPATLRGRESVQAFLRQRVQQLAEARISHKIRDLIFDGQRGAFIGYVRGPDATEKDFLVWFEIRDRKIARYLLRPL
jgi:ketosteroid isomerase-like protein